MNIPINKSPDKSTKTGTIRMGREIVTKPTSGDPDQDRITAENQEKEKIRMDEASSLV